MQYGGTVCQYAERRGNRKDAWQWSVSGAKGVDFLRLIYPYLLLKKPQADLALQFQTKKIGKPLNDMDWALQEADYILSRKYNKRGKM